jgi:hypothetical protein
MQNQKCMIEKFKTPALIVCICLLISCNGKSDTDEEHPGNQIDLADPAAMSDSLTQPGDTVQAQDNTGSGGTVDQDPVNKGVIIDTMSSQRH